MNEKVEESFPESRIHSFLNDIIELCKKHKVNIYTDEIAGRSTTVLHFLDWETFSELEACPDSSSVYWPRIESHVMHEESKTSVTFPQWKKKSLGKKNPDRGKSDG